MDKGIGIERLEVSGEITLTVEENGVQVEGDATVLGLYAMVDALVQTTVEASGVTREELLTILEGDK